MPEPSDLVQLRRFCQASGEPLRIEGDLGPFDIDLVFTIDIGCHRLEPGEV